MSDLLERLSTELILADGAMGTMLHGRGVSFDKCFDELNLTNPAAVADVHDGLIVLIHWSRGVQALQLPIVLLASQLPNPFA